MLKIVLSYLSKSRASVWPTCYFKFCASSKALRVYLKKKMSLNGQISCPPETIPYTIEGEIGKEDRRGQKEERGEAEGTA